MNGFREWARMQVRKTRAALLRLVNGFDLEISYSLTGIWLGLWILLGGAISSTNPSVRGLRLLSASVQWLPWNVDYTWAAMLVIPAAMQLWHRHHARARARVKYAMMQAMVFSFIALLLFLDYPPSTGIAMYSMPAIAQVIVMRKIIIESYA
jgi:hypothetical protein